MKYGYEVLSCTPVLDGDTTRYTLAVGIVEGKPVFPGDTIYYRSTGATVITPAGAVGWSWEEYSWKKEDPYAHLKAARAAGKRIAHGVYILPEEDTLCLEPREYRVLPDDEVAINHVLIFGYPIRVKYVKSGLNGSISVEVLK